MEIPHIRFSFFDLIIAMCWHVGMLACFTYRSSLSWHRVGSGQSQGPRQNLGGKLETNLIENLIYSDADTLTSFSLLHNSLYFAHSSHNTIA